MNEVTKDEHGTSGLVRSIAKDSFAGGRLIDANIQSEPACMCQAQSSCLWLRNGLCVCLLMRQLQVLRDSNGWLLSGDVTGLHGILASYIIIGNK